MEVASADIGPRWGGHDAERADARAHDAAGRSTTTADSGAGRDATGSGGIASSRSHASAAACADALGLF